MKNSLSYLLLVGLFSLLFIKGITPGWNRVHSDFANYYVSAKLVADGEELTNIYDNEWFQGKITDNGIAARGKFSPFPPITAWLLLPLTPFEPLIAQRIFTVINLFFVVIGSLVLKKLTDWTILHCSIVILGCGLGLINNISFGQVYLIMMVFMLISLLLIESKHFLLAGIILGFFASVKYFPIAIILGLFLNGATQYYQTHRSIHNNALNLDLKVSFWAIVTLVVLIGCQFLFLGSTVMSKFFSASFLPHLDGKLSGQDTYSYYYQSWSDMFMRLFVYDEQLNPNPFVNWAPMKTIMKIAIGLLVAVPMGIIFYRFKNAPVNMRRAVFTSLPGLGMLVLLPVSATYHFILLISSLALLMRDSLLAKKYKIRAFLIYAGIGHLPYGFIFRLSDTLGMWFAYPRLWLVSLLVGVVIAGLSQSSKIFITKN